MYLMLKNNNNREDVKIYVFRLRKWYHYTNVFYVKIIDAVGVLSYTKDTMLLYTYTTNAANNIVVG